LDTIKNIFEKNYQIKISDIIPHHQALKLSLTDYIEKLSSTIVIDVKNQITNISLIHRSKLVKCISKTNTYEIPNDISDYNLYNIMQHIKSQIPEVILRPAKNIVIYGNIDSNISTNNIALKVFEKNCSIIDATNSTQKPINGLVKHANTQAMNEKNYWGISNKKLNIISLLKDIIDENL
jgi:hypothetical protein